MFKVVKSQRPTDWTTKNYRDPIVVRALRKDFYGKCYICEQKHFPNLNVEHFIPHLDDEDLKFDWNNLYFACSRCNSIKNKYYNDMLDCCNKDHLVEDWIKLYFINPDDDIKVINTCPKDNPLYHNASIAQELIDNCYNKSDSSGTQEISKEDLREKILDEYNEFQTMRINFIKNLDKLLDDEKIHEAKKIKLRLKSHYPFSAILRGVLDKDSKLREALQEIEVIEFQQSA
ncbi:HNH endonuclease [Acinetobacter pittii]|uniref:HNH endonuclease n=1 Tax=Acinetobacter pittii TaxID=48296 RepID=UPI000D37C94F|nr:HNH endonuclease [Acinetobacter pittii]PTV49865.1 hypothetical protein DBL01_05210 [Acinetobacter pittii]